MKFFKVTLNTVGKDNEKVFFIVPPAEEKDENGNPAYDEDFLLSSAEYKSYLKETKAAVVSVTYVLYEADDSTKLNYDELLKSESQFFKLDQNEYIIEVKKAKPKGGSGKKTSATLYVIIAAVAAAIIFMLLYGSSRKNSGDPVDGSSDTSSMSDTSTEPSEDSETTSNEESSISDEATTADLTTSAETSSETETEAPTSEPLVTEPPVTAASTVTLTFDKNGGVGSLNEAEYVSGTVVELPYTGVSRIGYTLMGWATAPTEPYTLYDNAASRYVMPSEPVTLYAIWTAAEYEVTYNYQIGGNAVTSKERGKYGEIIQLRDISNVASDAGEFAGWGLLPNADEPVQSLTMPDGGIELYAIYKKGTETPNESTSTALL